MVLAGPDAMGAPTKDLSWLSANVVFANSRIQPIFKSTSLPSAVIWAKEILLLRTAFNFQNRLSRGVIKGNDGGDSPFWWYNPSLRCQKHVCIRTEFAFRRWMMPMIKQSHILYRPCCPSPTRDFHSLQISQPYLLGSWLAFNWNQFLSPKNPDIQLRSRNPDQRQGSYRIRFQMEIVGIHFSSLSCDPNTTILLRLETSVKDTPKWPA
ncbi:hypothetical protein HCBG_07769 [Histoplasma capsulatum G186AR]|uniref:Uncharacterized protein n=1 Tax=Ajellomyces capsulatus (strain G186AR / H82 / ATCC MYA-2454 / RMSCC 2432) TaxID=447093 RepID=C0NXX5_AJECG|nr:uncharacterized protein HCBG_07769 [Histoplasma capsulatum G186AR]EEH03643.1 hypothetical protein HCBG_07769 [Histoplasma capsulatum G186AR]